MCHDGHFSSPLPCFVCVGWVVSCCFLVGELNFDLFLTSSNNLTATVESNAALDRFVSLVDGHWYLLAGGDWWFSFVSLEPKHAMTYN